MAPFSGSGAKKRPREVDSEERSFDPGVVKKMRRENVSIQGDQPNDSPSPTNTSSVELQNGGKVDAGREDEAAPAIGPDDYKGALSGSGESDHEVESQSEGEGVSPSSLASKGKLKPSVAPRMYVLLCIVCVSYSLVTQLDLRIQVILEPPQYRRICPPHTNGRIALPELLLLKLKLQGR